MADTQDDAFGFANVGNSIKDRIRQIKPAAPPAQPLNLAAVDAAAENAGFVSREAPPPPVDFPTRVLRKQRAEPRVPLSMRVPISLGDSFLRFCEENRYSYPEGLAEIMRRAGLPLR